MRCSHKGTFGRQCKRETTTNGNYCKKHCCQIKTENGMICGLDKKSESHFCIIHACEHSSCTNQKVGTYYCQYCVCCYSDCQQLRIYGQRHMCPDHVGFCDKCHVNVCIQGYTLCMTCENARRRKQIRDEAVRKFRNDMENIWRDHRRRY